MDLSEVKILDLTHLLPGPYATQLLADLGAEVIKIEQTGPGDMGRYADPYTDRGVGAMFSMVNAGKKSITLDLKKEEAQRVLHSLVEDADALVEQFRPGVAERLGASYDTVRDVNPDIIYCSLTGYGQSGEKSNWAGHDLNYNALAGYLDMNRETDDDKPVIPGYPIADMSGGVFTAFTVALGLLNRELNGGGEYIDVAMRDAVLSFSHAVSADAFMDMDPRPGETRLSGGLPCYDIYETGNGRYISLAALEPKFWKRFCEEVGLDEYISSHLPDSEEEADEVRGEVQSLFRSRSLEEWMEFFNEDKVPVAPVLKPSEAVDEEDLERRDLLVDMDGYRRIGFPAVFGESVEPSSDVPGKGEHRYQVLMEAGYSEDEINSLEEKDVF